VGLSVVEDREVKAGVGDDFDFDDFPCVIVKGRIMGRRLRGARQLYGHIASSKNGDISDTLHPEDLCALPTLRIR
jgi:hypothetical protein